jgi:hypothetical protein
MTVMIVRFRTEPVDLGQSRIGRNPLEPKKKIAVG